MRAFSLWYTLFTIYTFKSFAEITVVNDDWIKWYISVKNAVRGLVININ